METVDFSPTIPRTESGRPLAAVRKGVSGNVTSRDRHTVQGAVSSTKQESRQSFSPASLPTGLHSSGDRAVDSLSPPENTARRLGSSVRNCPLVIYGVLIIRTWSRSLAGYSDRAFTTWTIPITSITAPTAIRAPELFVPRRASCPLAPPTIPTSPKMMFHIVITVSKT